jgi:hypothetical protein
MLYREPYEQIFIYETRADEYERLGNLVEAKWQREQAEDIRQSTNHLRYTLKQDMDRKLAGWGEHFWIVDTSNNSLMRLLPMPDAAVEADRLNAIPAPH